MTLIHFSPTDLAAISYEDPIESPAAGCGITADRQQLAGSGLFT